MKNPNSFTISAIAALGNQRQIGKGNQLLWDIPEDLKRFKQLTSGQAVIMGRKTWESLPETVRPLPDRENIVLTRDDTYEAAGAVVKNDLESAFAYAKDWSREHEREEIFIIGGATVYKQALPQTDKLYLTLVDSDKAGDTFFPKYEENFTEVSREEHPSKEPAFLFVSLVKK